MKESFLRSPFVSLLTLTVGFGMEPEEDLLTEVPLSPLPLLLLRSVSLRPEVDPKASTGSST